MAKAATENRKRFSRAAVLEYVRQRRAYYRVEFDRMSNVSWAQHKFMVANGVRRGHEDLVVDKDQGRIGAAAWLLATAVALEEFEDLENEIDYWQQRRKVWQKT